MAAQPKFDEMIELFQKGNDFELTAKQYANKTGAEFPKDKNYAEKRSAARARRDDPWPCRGVWLFLFRPGRCGRQRGTYPAFRNAA